jgi:hypothetical protein
MHDFGRAGETYGALTVIRLDRTTVETSWWICGCKCGQTRNVEERRLLKGQIATCVNCEVKHKMERSD